MGAGGRALRGSAFATVLRSTAHSSLRRSPPIPNAVVRTKGLVFNWRLSLHVLTQTATTKYFQIGVR